MDFKSWTFVIFIFSALLCYYIAPKKHRWILLLISSLVFYAFTGIFNIAFIFFTSLVTFFGAVSVSRLNSVLQQKKQEISKDEFKIEKSRTTTKKRKVLVVILLAAFGVLAALKYIFPFTGFKNLLLPLGISFYTFQTIAYFMDIYNGKYECEKNFFRYLLFVSFFPQLIMGPINRYNQLGLQLKEEKPFDFENFKHGFMLILFGAVKKYCIADLLVEKIAAVLDTSVGVPGFFIGGTIITYSIYQYADFSGGIDMVMGFSELFGLKMQPNFRQPYFATTLADFWRRWHISLGLWMKDYVFYPLALTKKMQNISKYFLEKKTAFSKHLARTVPAGIGNLVVFLLVGIWHGSEMHFVLWGLYNGLVIAVSDFFKPVFEKINVALHINVKSAGWKVFQIIRTFFIVNIGAYFDRIVDVKKSFVYLKKTFFEPGFSSIRTVFTRDYLLNVFDDLGGVDSEVAIIFLACVIVFVTSVLKERKVDVYQAIQKKNIVFRWLSYYVLMALVILAFSYAPGSPVFMYAQF